MSGLGRRPRWVAGNWKMHRTGPEGAALVRECMALAAADAAHESRVRVLVCPPFTALTEVGVAIAGGGFLLGAQNMHAEAEGAFTGEISAAMLLAAGCRFVLLGHSERRQLMGETDAGVASKTRAALAAGLSPVVCVGETLAEREGGRTADVLVRQVAAVYAGMSATEAGRTLIAYEPVWAIGTGKVASPEQAVEAHRIIRSTLDRVVATGAGDAMPVLYGGSVNGDNAPALFAHADVDGALVGGASLKAAGFWRIAAAAATAP